MRVGDVSTVLARTLSAAVALLHDGTLNASHSGHLPAVVPGVLAPLVLPRMGATIRRALSVDWRSAGGSTAGSDASFAPSVKFTSMADLARENARLQRELAELKAKYARLAEDAADQAAESERFHHLALHDALTQLPNRLLLMDRIAAALAHAERAGTQVLVIFLDLDHFKAINDIMGHAAGDRVLSEVAIRIAGCTRRSDTASRVGGDEFVLVCATEDAVADAADIRSRLGRAIAAPIDVNGTPVTIGASIGISSFPADGADPGELIDRADQAMYHVKARR
ncbi:MAG: GGDEF domain-containing protein [Candidatus Velthaea sp.]